MSMATVLATLDGGGSDAAAVEAALHLGQRFGARVDLLHVEPDVTTAVPIVGEGMSGAAVEQIMKSLQDEAQSRAKAAQELFESRCVKKKLPIAEPDGPLQAGKFSVSFRHVVGRQEEEVVRRGRLADLVVVARPPVGEDAEGTPDFDAALFDTGRPVLLVPSKPVSDLGETVAVAWNHSREAARAVAAALPFLAKAKKVLVLTAREVENAPEPSELVRYLGGHGVNAQTWAFKPGPGSIGDALLGEAKKAGADLLVMGAYGHSRLRELVLGGATRGVLSHGAVPVLLVH